MEAVRLAGFRELNRALARAEKETRTEFRVGFRKIAEPVRVDAEMLARQNITRITEPWARMRTGVTQRLVYVAPRERGVKQANSARKRPKFARLLMDRAMQPALERNEGKIVAGIETLLDHVGETFNREA